MGGISRGWNSVPFTAESGGVHFLRVWAGMDEVQRGPGGRPDDFGAPGRGNRYANVNVFAAVWSTRESERDIRDHRVQMTVVLEVGVVITAGFITGL